VNLKKLLKPLYDGTWHQFDDLSAQTKIDKNTVLIVVDSLKDYGILELSKDHEAVKLDDGFLKL
jgi:hypothetical protein